MQSIGRETCSNETVAKFYPDAPRAARDVYAGATEHDIHQPGFVTGKMGQPFQSRKGLFYVDDQFESIFGIENKARFSPNLTTDFSQSWLASADVN